MDLLLPLISGLGIIGYNLNTTKNERLSSKERTVLSNNELPTENLYSKEMSESERLLSEAKYIQSKDPATTNVIPPFFNNTCITNDCSTTQFNSVLPSVTSIDQTNDKLNNILSGPMFNSALSNSLENNNFSPIKETFANTGVSYLSGCTFDNTHNNMVPFFGGSVKQNTNGYTLDKHTGNSYQQAKSECNALFQPVKQNIYGTQVEQDRTRYQQSNLKTSLLPFPQIREAPLPPDSFRGKFKNINQLHVKQRITNKTPHTIRANMASLVSQPIAAQKNRPESSYQSGIQNSFVQGQLKQQAPLNFRNGYQSSTELEPNHGSAFSNTGNRVSTLKESDLKNAINDIDSILFSISTDDNRYSEKRNEFRNAGGNKAATSREGFSALPETERDTSNSTRINIAQDLKAGYRLRNKQKARTTNKEITLYSYKGNATTETKNATGYQGLTTRKTDKLTRKNYIGNPEFSSGQKRLRDSYEDTEIKTNREVERNYDHSLGDTSVPTGKSIPIGSDSIGKFHYKKGTEENKRLYGNSSANTKNIRPRDMNEEPAFNRETTEHDYQDRLSNDFTSQLLDNEYAIKR